jgi:outer membrane autotransporter protein
MVINGGTGSGDTVLRFTNVGGTGAQTIQGIQVVEAANGSTTTVDAFSLGGVRYTAGAYEYTLERKGESWYLTNYVGAPQPPVDPAPTPEPPADPEPSVPPALPTPTPPTPPARPESPVPPPAPQPPVAPAPPVTPETPVQPEAPAAPQAPKYRPEAAVDAPMPAMGRSLALATLGTLHERVGEEENLRGVASSRDIANGVWGRVFGERQTNRFAGSTNPSVDGRLWGVQAGMDLYRHTTDGNRRNHAGLYFAYGWFNSTSVRGNILGETNAQAGSISLLGPSVGAYWTHVSPSGGYLDGVIQKSWYDTTAVSISRSGLKTQVEVLTASLEAGYPVHVGGNGTWVIEPQAQAIYQDVSVDATHDNLSQIAWVTGDAWTGRLGVRVQRTNYTDDRNREIHPADWRGPAMQPYGRVNLWRHFNGTDQVSFDGSLPIGTRFGGTLLEGAGGVTTKIKKTTSVYGEVGYRASLGASPQKTTALSGSGGLRLNW